MNNNNNNTKYTPEQEAAIEYRGGTLLVSSAAGSGKTMVLVDRLLGYIDEGAGIDEFLVITYTRAAAAELRERISSKLRERLADDPSNRHLRRQSMLCRGAFIDTIHTFCSVLLRENAHIAGLAPDLRVADENECNIIKSEVLEDVFDRTYDNITGRKELSELLRNTIDGRDDKILQETVLDIYSKLMSTPDPEGWINRQIDKERHTDNISDVMQTQYGVFLMQTLYEKTEHCLSKMLTLQEEMAIHPDFADAYAESVEETVNDIQSLLQAMTKSWDDAVENSCIAFNRVKPVKGYDELKAIRTWCKGEMDKICKVLDTSSDDHIKDMKQISPVIIALFELILEFDKAYAEEKRKRSVADFSDLEHMTLSLLYNKETGEKTTVAASTAKRFREILVDEYQDVNEVQEMLFNALSRDGSNMFMVGDVKQSIYRFRLAEPEIFLRKYRDYEELAELGALREVAQNPVRINLSMNFRSKSGILNAVNHIFRRLMSVPLGEMEYTKAQELTTGREENIKQGKQGKQGLIVTPCDATVTAEMYDADVEIDLISTDSDTEEEEESPSVVQIEAEHTAKRIKEMIDSSYVIKERDGSTRQIRYSDIAILARSIKSIAWRFASALSEQGIPSDIPSSESFFEQVEVQAAMSLLTVIDNPLQDIELASVLCGPIYELTSDEMAEIRICARGTGFFDALKRSQEPDATSPATACKCKRVLEDLSELRSEVNDYSADRFIRNAYNKVGLLKRVIAMKGGEKRRDNLFALVELAENFEKSGFKGLFLFLQYINDLKERDVDISASPNVSSGEMTGSDAVKILSVHKSKGLEFPVVFLVNTSKGHNMTDLNKMYVFHKSLGVGTMLTDSARRVRFTTLARSAITEKLKCELLSEELRILYVAMTRAREKLVITAAFGDVEKVYDKVKLLSDKNGNYSPHALMSLGSIAHWVIAATIDIDEEDPDVKINIIKRDDCVNPTEDTDSNTADESSGKSKVTSGEKTAGNSSALNGGANAFLYGDYKYPFEAAVNLPSKLTVTGLKTVMSNIDPEADSAKWLQSGSEQKTDNLRRPVFITDRLNTDPTRRGTIIHEIMKYLDFTMCSNERDIRKDIERIVKLELIDELDAAQVGKDIDMIAALFSSELGQRLKNAENIAREFKFSLLTSAERYFEGGGDDKILLQGIIDCFFEENGELIVVDFKTDNVNSNNIGDRVKRYTPQLEAYSEALERMTGKRVRERIIYFFKTGAAVNV